MIQNRIKKYKEDIALAKKLSENKYADKEYYQKIIDKNKKLLNFYEKFLSN